ncbi:carbohydrate porin [Pseudomonas tohonis]|uniref:carbohydrate porin n=1 Tax=Pseudomonas tohonis TaxID=2725477 RepID=UPI003A5BDF81
MALRPATTHPRRRPPPDRGLHAVANVTHNDPRSNMIGNLLQAGLIYRSPTASRPRDTIGVGVSRFQANTDFRRNAQLINTLNQVTSIRDPRYVPIQDREYSFEVNYGYQATGWLMIRPNRQYVRYPGGMREVDDAVVVGVQVITDL